MTRKAPWYQAAHPHGVPKRPRKPVRRVSAAQALRNAEYRVKVTAWKALPENQKCAFSAWYYGNFCPCGGMIDCHHSRGKLGPLLLDERFWKPICRTHHTWIDANRTAARVLGLLAPFGEWNRMPQV